MTEDPLTGDATGDEFLRLRIFMLCSCLALSAQGEQQVLPSLDPHVALHQYVHESWQGDEGLPAYAIHAIRQTRTGYLWLGTQGGLVRFDGVTFKVYNRVNTPSLESSLVSSLHEARDGGLWIGTHGSGLLRWHRGQVTRVPLGDAEVFDTVSAMAEDRSGRLWVATTAGLARYDNGRFTVVTADDGSPLDGISALAAAGDGGIWIGTIHGELTRFNNKEWTAVDTGVGSGAEISSMLEDRGGHLWVISETGRQLLRRFDSQHWRTYHEIVEPKTIFQDRAATIWVGTNLGLIRLDGETSTRFTVADGLTDDRTYSLYEDREGSLWIGTYAGGLNRLRNGKVLSYTQKDGLSSKRVNSVCEDRQGSLWIGTAQGLMRYQNGRWSPVAVPESLLGADIRAIYEDRDRHLWVGTDGGGLYRWENGQLAIVDERVELAAHTLLGDLTGALWIGTENGLRRYRDNGWTVYTVQDGLPERRVQALHLDRAGTLWIGTRGGLARFTGPTISSQDLPTAWIRALHEDADGTLWIGTVGEGLYRLRDQQLVRYTIADGLPDDYVWDILEDDQGWLWMSSDQGLFAVPKRDLEAYARGEIQQLGSRRFGEADGMADVEGVGFVHPGAIRTRSGDLWFPTMKGVVRVDPDRIHRNPLPPPVHVESVVSNGASVPMPAVEPPSPLVLTPDQRDIEIYYTGTSFLYPDRVRFRYRLEGYDDDWIDVGARRVAFYTNLPPGAYVFHVLAANEDGVWNPTGASLALVRRPFFTETRWFYALCGLLVAALGYGAYELRTRDMRAFNLRLAAEAAERRRAEAVVEAKNRELAIKNVELAEKNTELEERNAEMERFIYTVSHDLKSPLFSIKGFLGYLKKDMAKGNTEALARDSAEIGKAVDHMGRLLNDLLEYSRIGRVISTSISVPLGHLVQEAVGLVSGTLNERGVEVSVQPDMPRVWGDPIRLVEVYQNLVENASKFTGAQPHPRVEVGCLEPRDGFVTCFVRDNGSGIAAQYQERVFGLFERLDPSVEGTGVGLTLVKRIVELHGGQIWVDSDGAGQGSTFYFPLPLQDSADS